MQEKYKYFTVYSEDQVDARYILSTNLMEKLVDFRQKANKNIYASFVDDMIYFAIEYPDGLFEANLYRSMLSFAPLREYFEAIQLMLGLVKELNLDRQIWQYPNLEEPCHAERSVIRRISRRVASKKFGGERDSSLRSE